MFVKASLAEVEIEVLKSKLLDYALHNHELKNEVARLAYQEAFVLQEVERLVSLDA